MTINYFSNFIIKRYFYGIKNRVYNYNANMNYNVKHIGLFFPQIFQALNMEKYCTLFSILLLLRQFSARMVERDLHTALMLRRSNIERRRMCAHICIIAGKLRTHTYIHTRTQSLRSRFRRYGGCIRVALVREIASRLRSISRAFIIFGISATQCGDVRYE